MCKESRVVLRSAENTTCVILVKKQVFKLQKKSHFVTLRRISEPYIFFSELLLLPAAITTLRHQIWYSTCLRVCVCVCVCVWINKPKIGSGDIYLYRRVSGCDYFGRFVCLFRRVSKISFTARHCGPNSLEFSAWQFAWSSCWAWSVSTWLENASVWVTLRLV